MRAAEADAFSFVLVGTKSPGNVGAAARALANLGFGRLVLAEPVLYRDAGYLSGQARRMAVGGERVLASMQVADALDTALPPHACVVATSARVRSRPRFEDLRLAAPQLLEAARRGPVAVLFGPEDDGLGRRHLARADRGVVIPTGCEQPSLNVAQAVLLVAWELWRAAAEPPEPAPPEPIDPAQLGALVADLERGLAEIGFLKAHNRTRIVSDLRSLLLRAGPGPRDLSVLRGVVRQLRWKARQGSDLL